MSAPRLKSTEFRKEREASWRELERLVDRCERKGIRSLEAAELARLPVLYRATVSSLSVARAISLDRNLVEYLEALSTRAYSSVYGVRRGLREHGPRVRPPPVPADRAGRTPARSCSARCSSSSARSRGRC